MEIAQSGTNVDKRLLTAAKYVTKGKTSVDIGTDHAYLPVFLYKNGISTDIIACDINQKPLDAAKKTIAQAGLEGKIRLCLSNGLEKISSDEADNIIICGMGGELILQILLSAPFELTGLHNLVLQPMTNISLLRKGLYEHGFEILSETPVVDRHHFYTVMQAKKLDNSTSIEVTEDFALLGKIPLSADEDRNAYISHVITQQKKIADGLKKSKEKHGDYLHYEETAKRLSKFIDEE